MTVTVASFRVAFPVFTSTALYPDAQVQFWMDVAGQMINVDRWGALADLGVQLITAHNLILEAQANRVAARAGKVGGLSSGVMTSKSVDKVSASYDVSSATEKDAGHWNLTIYGTRYVRFARMMGAGALQVGVWDGSSAPVYPTQWAGPPWSH